MPERTPEQAARRARVVELRRARLSWFEIGDELGVSRQRARQLYDAALAEAPVAQVEEHRAEEQLLADDVTCELLALGRDPSIPARTRVEAYAVACRWAERKAQLLGLNAPATSRVQLITESDIDAEIARLTAELTQRPQD
ncbi:hypothetical protein [Pseudonocardia sp. ICBG601]|uniref:hypothetical protein n=1 Tax=Pseudonocardia sp. ICBG601 TaxID=2846759 RepID=UPI001CF717F6|nr:hypothetical protein [Pseudonocardia sp. ICBG601]